MPGLNSQDAACTYFEDITHNAAQIQKIVLRAILEHNASCEYLRKCGLSIGFGQLHVDDDTLVSTFKRSVPLISHSDITSYIQRIVDGDKSSILTATPIDAISLSSGTTEAREKYIPFFEGLRTGTLEVARIAAAYRNRVYPLTPGARILEFSFCGKLFTTKGGLRAGTATTHLIRSDAFKMRQKNALLKSCSPDEVVLGSDCRQGMYCHLLCGLVHAYDVEVISATFAYTLVEALRTLETEWQSLCEDIRLGKLSVKITDPSLRAAVLGKVLTRPNATLADVMQHKCRVTMSSCHPWQGVVQKLWPRCKYVLSIVTGTMEAYLEKLQHYMGSEIPLVSADYGATEGWVAVNVNPRSSPGHVSFTVVPSLAYFEFIPLYKKSSLLLSEGRPVSTVAYEEGEPVGLTEVKVGQQYEIVMTTTGGLYRYRLGDVLRVTSFFNSSPQFSYVCRKNVILSINIDKNTETDLKLVVHSAAKYLADASGRAMQLVDYTSYADLKTTVGHYVIFWEVGDTQTVSRLGNQRLLAECATLKDGAFVEPGYVTSRKMNTIGALELCIVRRGTFKNLLDRFMARSGATITQYKTPRCIATSSEMLAVLRDSTYATHFSSATFR